MWGGQVRPVSPRGSEATRMERMAKVDPTVMIDSVIMIDHFNDEMTSRLRILPIQRKSNPSH